MVYCAKRMMFGTWRSICQSNLHRTLVQKSILQLSGNLNSGGEYIHGEIIAMTGASRRHNLIVANIIGGLRQQLKSKPCELYTNDMRVKIQAASVYTYPMEPHTQGHSIVIGNIVIDRWAICSIILDCLCGQRCNNVIGCCSTSFYTTYESWF